MIPRHCAPSLTAILDLYIRNRLAIEHRGKPIVVCVCLGGDVREEVRPDLRAFFGQHSRRGGRNRGSKKISFEEWNGDKLAKLIQENFLSEELLRTGARANLRKSLALLDEPASSFGHFAAVVRSLAETREVTEAERIRAIRQMSLCLWILFAWCREAGNTEAAFLAGELTLLHGWTIFKDFADKETKAGEAVRLVFFSIYDSYQAISGEFMKSVLPHVGKPHGLSMAVRSASRLDVNLKLFDLLGRVGVTGLWTYWTATRMAEEQAEERTLFLKQVTRLGHAAKAMIDNNPTLLLPTTEDQAIDVGIALFLLALDENNADVMSDWISEIVRRAAFALRSHLYYPCTLRRYGDLIRHPKQGDQEYLKEVTAGSILYPLVAVWAALLGDHEVYEKVAALKRDELNHCTFQYWFPDETTENHLYTSDEPHGATLTNVCVDRSEAELLAQVFSECKATPHFDELSAVKLNWWPLVVLACRHHRLPLPLHLLMPLWRQPGTSEAGED